MKLWIVFALAVGSLSAGEVSPAPSPNTAAPPKAEPNLWPEDFNPETGSERVDTDTGTDEDVIIMEEDEDSEQVPGNAENVTG